MISRSLFKWVNDIAELAIPDQLYWCKGTENEFRELTYIAHNQLKKLLKGHFISPDDISKLLVNKPGNWSSIIEEYKLKDDLPILKMFTDEQTQVQRSLYKIFENSMKGRIMYVIPFSMSPRGAPVEHVAVELTDSPLAVVLKYQTTVVGDHAMNANTEYVRSIHTRGKMYRASDVASLNQPVNFQKKFIIAYPENGTIWSYGTFYGSIRPKQTTRYAWWV